MFQRRICKDHAHHQPSLRQAVPYTTHVNREAAASDCLGQHIIFGTQYYAPPTCRESNLALHTAYTGTSVYSINQSRGNMPSRRTPELSTHPGSMLRSTTIKIHKSTQVGEPLFVRNYAKQLTSSAFERLRILPYSSRQSCSRYMLLCGICSLLSITTRHSR